MGTVLCMPNLYKMANHSHDQLFVQALNVSFTIKASHLKNENPNVQTVGENTGGPRAVKKSGVAFALKQNMNQDQRSERLLSKTRNTSYSFPLSDFFPCTIHVFGIHLALQHTLFNILKPSLGDLSKATAIQAAETALDAKMISKTIQINDVLVNRKN